MANAEAARHLANLFGSKRRDNGETYVTFETDDDADYQTLLAMTCAANQAGINHDDAYQMVWDALQQIADTDPDAIEDTDRDGLIDVYTHSLMAWLARNWPLADELHDEYGQWPETMNDIAMQTQDYAYGLVFGAIAANWPDTDDDAE